MVNFCDRLKQSQITIEARYGEKPVVYMEPEPEPEPEPETERKTTTFLEEDFDSTTESEVYEVQYVIQDEQKKPELTLEMIKGEVVYIDMDKKDKKDDKKADQEEEDQLEELEIEEVNVQDDHQVLEQNEDNAIITTIYLPELSQAVDVEDSKPELDYQPPKRRRFVIEPTVSSPKESSEALTKTLKDSGMLTCKECVQGFKDFRSMKVHNELEHEIIGVECCKTLYTSRVRAFEHVSNHKKGSPAKTTKNQTNKNHIQCKKCSFTCLAETVLKRHMLSHIPPSKRAIPCELCDFRCNFRSQLTTHMQSRHSTDKLVHHCEECSKAFSTKGNLMYHMKTQHVEEIPRETCPKCEKSVQRLAKHQQICQVKLDLKCPYPDCSSIHPNNHALKTHISRMHLQDVAKCTCPHCGKVLTRASHLQEHIATHTKKFLYHCKHCMKGFYNNSNLLKHVKFKHRDELEAEKK